MLESNLKKNERQSSSMVESPTMRASPTGNGLPYQPWSMPVPESSQASLPFVSILITVYNGEPFVGASVSAALSQDYPNFEVVVVDDGSQDRTGDLCRAIEDRRLRYIRRERIGRRKALNEGIALAGGEFIAINDADDLSFPHRLTSSMRCFTEKPDLAFLGTAYVSIEQFHQRIPAHLLERQSEVPIRRTRLTATRLYRSNPLVNSTVMFPKRIWAALGGYDEQLTNCEDYDFFLRAMQWGEAAWLSDPTVLWYANPTSFFKRISAGEYWRTLRFIKRRARRVLNLPTWVSLYDGLDLYQAAKSGALQYQARWRSTGTWCPRG